jgi:hypothetical protein
MYCVASTLAYVYCDMEGPYGTRCTEETVNYHYAGNCEGSQSAGWNCVDCDEEYYRTSLTMRRVPCSYGYDAELCPEGD